MPTFTRALVTGASSGIGRDIARQFAEAGTHLVLVARSTDALTALADELSGAHGVDAEVLTADLADADARHAVEERLRRVDAPVDLLVNNAGYSTSGPFGSATAEAELGQIDVNVLALARLTHAAIPGMLGRAADGARQGVLNVASVAAFQATPMMATYAATKAFVVSFTEALAEEFSHKGLTFTALCPGPTPTGFADRAEMSLNKLPSLAQTSSEEVARAGIAAVTAGRTVEIPGLANRAMRIVSGVTPAPILRRATGLMMSQMTER